MIVLVLPGVRLVSLTNVREHHMVRAGRARAQRSTVRWALLGQAGIQHLREANGHGERLLVRIVRIGPRALDSDNLAASAKHVRDGVAEALGIDDADPRITWRYGQIRGKYGVRIEIRLYEVCYEWTDARGQIHRSYPR